MKRLVVCAVLMTAMACGDDHDGNRAPSIAGLALTTAEDTTLLIDLGQLALLDPDRDILTVTFGAPEHGTIAGSRPWAYTPEHDFTGTDHVVVTVTDGALSGTATVTIEVTAVNDAPVARDDSFATAEDIRLEVATGTLLANDTDPDSFGLSLTTVGGAVDGSVALVGSAVVFTPRPDHVGSARFTYTITDGFLTATAQVVVVVGGANDPPVAVGDAFTIDEDQSLVLSGSELVANDTDPEGMTLEVVSVQGAEHGSALLDGTTVMFMPDGDFHGGARFEYTVRDGSATDTGVVTVTVNPVNDRPVATDDAVTTDEDTPAAIPVATLLGNDRDVDGDPLTVREVGGATGGTVALSGGVVTFTPTPDRADAGSFTYTISDGTAMATATVAVTVVPVNDGPVAVDDAVAGTEDAMLTIAVADLLANDSDADGDPLTLESVGTATGGAVAVVGDDVLFTPVANALAGSFAYVVTDGTATATATVMITLAPVNDPPVATADFATTAEDTPVTISLVELLGDDTDVDGDVVSLVTARNPDHGEVELVAGGVLYTPEEDFDGVAHFDYVISDGTSTSVGEVTVTITPVNDPPIAVDDEQPTQEDTPVEIAAFVLLSNDHDPEGDHLTVAAVRDADHGDVALAGGVVTFTPDRDFTGDASFVYDLSDGQLTVAATVVIHVAPVDDPPVVTDDRVMTSEDVPAVIAAATLLGNDRDPDGDTLTVTAVRAPSHGAVELDGATITFRPDLDFHGDASFEYVATGSSASAPGRVTVVVSPVNDAPVTVADTLTTAEDTPLTFAVSALLGNDRDVDGEALVLVALQREQHGTAVRTGDQITFTPAANFSGDATFEYLVGDGTATTPGLVTVRVTPVDDPPIAVADGVTTPEDTAVLIPVATLLANDTDVDSTPTITAVRGASSGTVGLDAGVVTYTPPANGSGMATFEYVLEDATSSAVGLVTVTITPDNDPPVAAGASVVVLTEDSVDITLTATDVDSAALTYTIVLAPRHGVLTGVPPALTYTSEPGYVGADGFMFRVSDGEDFSDAWVMLTVRPPVCGDGTAEGGELCDDGNLDNGDGCDRNCTPTGCGNGEVGGFAASSVTFIWLGTTCENTPGEIRFRIAGQLVHRQTLSPFCDCALDPITSVTLTDPAVLALVNGPTSLTVEVTGTGNYLGWAAVQIRPDSFSTSHVLFHILGGPDFEDLPPNLCDSGVEPEVVASVTRGFVEDCDDGGVVDGDGCNAVCEVEYCGDGVLQTGLGEECDDGNFVSGDGCEDDCTLP